MHRFSALRVGAASVRAVVVLTAVLATLMLAVTVAGHLQDRSASVAIESPFQVAAVVADVAIDADPRVAQRGVPRNEPLTMCAAVVTCIAGLAIFAIRLATERAILERVSNLDARPVVRCVRFSGARQDAGRIRLLFCVSRT